MKSAVLLITVFIIGVVGTACDGMSRVGGRVVDAEGRSLENASVLFEAIQKGEPKAAYECTVNTSVDGTFGCGIVHAPRNVKLRLTVDKDGYAKYIRELYSNDLAKSPGGNLGSQIITLERR